MIELKFEYGFRSVNGIVKKVYYLHDIPNIKEKCDVWNILPIVYVRPFTGLKDANGKDIYFGDVLKLPRNQNCVVVFHEDSYASQMVNPITFKETNRRLTKHYCLDKVVIGNIFETPDIL